MKSVPQSKKTHEIPKIDDAHFIQKSNGFIKGYAVNTFHGLVKNYNEDRVSIIMNITKPNYKGRWPKCSYFGVFDGHGGSSCSDFLKDNMHKYITENQFFPHKPIEALKQGFKNAEAQFLRIAESKNPVERSGSCAIVLLIIDQIGYVANVGDSRAILSTKSGKQVYAISRDHKPDSPNQKARIIEGGGNIYQSSIKKNGNIIYGPFRIEPGKLSVSRSFGDIEAKKPQYGGNPKVLIAKPEITYFTIDPSQHDFIMMGSDGIFDKMQNQDISQQFWNLRNQSIQSKLNQNKAEKLSFIGKSASRVITKAMTNMSLDNLTTLFVVFDCEDRILNQGLGVKDKNTTQAFHENTNKYERSKSTNQQKNTNHQDENISVSKFSLKRQVSKSILSTQNQKVHTSNLDTQNSKIIKAEQRKHPLTTTPRNFDAFKSTFLQRGQQQNMQYLANRQPGMSKNPKDEMIPSKATQIRSIESKFVSNMYTPSQFSQMGVGTLVRKKSQGMMRKDSKKESVWGAINRGLKNNQRAIEKIRY